jgi:hypothetical protein
VRFAFKILSFVLFVSGCATPPDEIASDGSLAGVFGASLDLHASARLRLKSDHSFEMYTQGWGWPKPEIGAISESGGPVLGHWRRNRNSVILNLADGRTRVLRVLVDHDVLILTEKNFRYEKLYSEESNQTPTSMLGTLGAEPPRGPSTLMAHL